MAAIQAEIAVGGGEALRPARSLWRDAWYTFTRDKLAVAGLAVTIVIVILVLGGPYVWTKSKDALDYGIALQPPTLAHPFGTDDLGRDMLARVLFGGRISIAVGIVSIVIAMTLGTAIGAFAGYFGKLDNLLMRVTDIFLSLPTLPVLLVLIYLFRDTLQRTLGEVEGIFVMIVAVIGVLNWMPVARLVRASFLSLKQKEFVEAARCIGATDARIIFQHLLPNALSPVLVAATIGVGGAIITESTLSFLGLGFPSDVPTWGRLLYDAQNYLDIAPYTSIFPGLAIFLIVLSINYVGDGLRDALDPRHRQR
ncbi:MAG: ABC transporter permease [Chloroflexota bacterium]|nr:ABC transporter permease [Chloroflexota bacterium]